MSPFLRLAVILVFFLVTYQFPHAAGAADEATINIGILPCSDVVKTYEEYQPLARYIANTTDRNVRLLVLESYGELVNLLQKGEVQFAIHGPGSYIRLAPFYDQQYLLKALTPDGSDTSTGLVITRADSNIFSLNDLRGKTVEFGPTTSGIKSLAAELLFYRAGISIEKDLGSHAHGGCCGDILLNVFFRKFDAGVICMHGFNELKDEGFDRSKIRIIAETPPVSTNVFAVNRSVSPDLAGSVADSLLALDKKNPAHKKILDAAGTGGFARTTDSRYDELRKAIKHIESMQ
ncbi:MAG: phosphate/phosphite/phosphonate ABC transporter substrate-binding protein [Desulfobulbaceae bacterium]|nr:phosphate/phosphite/phosphonate ABC transporter substrate-binding protein [Desulfobulbaceae bacterium]